MESQDNPLLLLSSSQGPIYIELLPDEAPQNVERFLSLAAGEVEFVDSVANSRFTPRYYDGMRFHRVLPGFVIQAGSPNYHPLGSPDQLLDDEINAFSLGLDRLPILAEDGSVNPVLNVGSQAQFGERVLSHVYAGMGIDTVAELESRQSDVVQNLRELTVMRLYEQEGYEYQNEFTTRGISRGTVALANDGPNRNGPEFFIALDDLAWLNGRYTVIGRVVEGMDVADQIGNTAVDPQAFDPRSTMIYSLRRINR
jgi:cyclophilin family peptidyl-prolyl cis-trans isomerase